MYQSSLFLELNKIQHGFGTLSDKPPPSLYSCTQVHDKSIYELKQNEANPETADGIFTATQRVIGIKTADCLPVLFASKNQKSIAAVHAGWRGLCLGILLETVNQFTKSGSEIEDIVVAIGPCIQSCCFEVNQTLIDQFNSKWSFLWNDKNLPYCNLQKQSINQRPQAKPTENNNWFNLPYFATLQLESIGFKKNQIDNLGICTYCGDKNLASYRLATHTNSKSSLQWSWIKKI